MTFKKITAFDLGLYNLDSYMTKMMLKWIPEDEKDKRREKIIAGLQKQYKTVIEDYDKEKETGGVRYTLDYLEYHEKHFDL